MNWACANTTCAQPLRRTGVRAVDAPGTLQVTADGLCKRCYNQRRRDAEVLTPQQLQAARNALDGWLQGRRNRISKRCPMCEANETLQRAKHALEVMIGNQVLDLGRLKQILDTQCDHEQ